MRFYSLGWRATPGLTKHIQLTAFPIKTRLDLAESLRVKLATLPEFPPQLGLTDTVRFFLTPPNFIHRFHISVCLNLRVRPTVPLHAPRIARCTRHTCRVRSPQTQPLTMLDHPVRRLGNRANDDGPTTTPLTDGFERSLGNCSRRFARLRAYK